MATWTILLLPTAQKDLDRHGNETRERVLNTLQRLAENPRAGGTRKLRGAVGLYRLRVGDYRAIFRILAAERQVLVAHVLHRSEVYRNLN
ncbi:MAG: type II toxin-antitoxin system RelE/ParE family toxin [Calditrichota bacterium]